MFYSGQNVKYLKSKIRTTERCISKLSIKLKGIERIGTSKAMKIRHFIYADAKEISSMYSQIFDDITEINTTVSKENKAEIKAEIPNILQGFLPGNLSGEYERDYSSIVSAQSHISIEKKVMSLLESAALNENNVITECKDKLLVVGLIETMRYDQFLEQVDWRLKKRGYKGFKGFYKKNCKSDNFSELWKKLVDKITSNKCRGIPFSILKASAAKPEIERLIVLNAKYPILISFSYDKVLLSASTMAMSTRFSCAENMSILGLMKQVGTGFYTIKPFAMWEIFESNKASERFLYQVKTFKEFHKKR